jgi:CBS domain-containing protein
VELVHDGEAVSVLETGEMFGHPSFLSGRAPAFTVRARERTELLAIPGPAALPHLTAEFIAATLRQRMVRAGEVVHAQADVRTAHLGDLVHRPAAICTPETTAGEAARLMAEKDVSCILVDTGSGFGIFTDSDVRSKLVARQLPYDTPVWQLMVPDALTVTPDRLAIDAMIDMLDRGIHHLPIVDANGRPLGVITATDLMYLESRTPFALRRSIGKAGSVEEVVAASGAIPQTVVALTHAGVSAADVCRVLALTCDTAVTRLLELAFLEHGEPPCAWSWMALGSGARRELTLASDQDNAFAYDDPGGEEADRHFAVVAEMVNSALALCGFGLDNSDVMARNRQWRMSKSEWARVFTECLEQPDRSHLVRAAVAFDFRHVVGGLDIVRPLVAIERQAPRHPDFLRRLARTATDFEPAVKRRGKLDTDGEGRVDMKKRAALPIANLARFHAIANGVTISGTVDRLAAAAAAGSLSTESATALTEAFDLIMDMRRDHHVAQVQAGLPPDDLLDPEALSPLARTQLIEALKLVAAEQKRLGRFVPIGI